MYVYGYRNKNNEIIYVGSTQHMVERYQQHQHEDEWMSLVDSVTVWGPYSHTDRLLLREGSYRPPLSPFQREHRNRLCQCQRPYSLSGR